VPPGLPKFVKVQPNPRNGQRYYFRQGRSYIRLPDDPASPEFYQRYAQLLANTAVVPRQPAEGSMDQVIASFRGSPGFQKMAPKTKRTYERHLNRFQAVGHRQVSEFKRRHIRELQKPLNATPATAQQFAAVSSALFAYAMDELELIDTNPALRIRRPDKPKPYTAWTDEECAAFETFDMSRSIRTGYMLGRWTGQRLGDVLRWTRSAYDGRFLRFKRSKTARLGKPEMVMPVLAPLKAYLDALPYGDTVMLIGEAIGEDHFRHKFREALDACGLQHLHFHGLRHAAGVALAEAGATEEEIMTWLGHATPAMAHHYCAQANAKKLALSAARKWETGAERGTGTPSPESGTSKP
jgi:integrase